MCGIAGVLSFDAPPDREVLARMTRAVVHRGPDDEGFFFDGPVGLGFRRLSIIDVSAGHQPMTLGACTVVFNGEIYNFRELRKELESKGRAFSTHSDTEVLVASYLEWGEACVDRLEGMFAFALWDAGRQRLVCARDRFGKKPFYWARVGGTFLFGSELKVLLQHPACPRALDAQALRRYLAFEYVPTPSAVFSGVHKLEASTCLTVDAQGLRERAFDPLPPVAPGPWRADDAAEELRARLGDAVRRRLVADVPLGIFLSGGIDSSAVAAFAVRERPGIETFSIGFDEGSYDESRYARAVAEALGTKHHEHRVSAAECLELIPQLADQLDEPFADSSYLPTFVLSRFARRHVTVALGGDGADELFAGYETLAVHHVGQAFGVLPQVVRAGLYEASKRLPSSSGYMSLDFKVKSFLRGAQYAPAVRHQAWIGAFTPPEVQALLAPPWRAPGDAERDIYGPLQSLAQRANTAGLERALRGYVQTYLKDDILVKVDRASMAASLEVRAPFLDRDFSRWVMGLPAHFKLRGTSRKWLLKRALRGVVPDVVLDRKKHGFALPVAAWLRGPLQPLLDDVLSADALRRAGIFEPAAVRALVDEHRTGRADHRKPLWTVLMFELWRRRWAS